MANDATTRSFALALYRVMLAVEPPNVPITFKMCEVPLMAYVNAYLDFDGKLPYNGFDGAKFFMSHAQIPEELQEFAMSPKDRICMKTQDAVMAELARVWLELSGVKDTQHNVH